MYAPVQCTPVRNVHNVRIVHRASVRLCIRLPSLHVPICSRPPHARGRNHPQNATFHPFEGGFERELSVSGDVWCVCMWIESTMAEESAVRVNPKP